MSSYCVLKGNYQEIVIYFLKKIYLTDFEVGKHIESNKTYFIFKIKVRFVSSKYGCNFYLGPWYKLSPACALLHFIHISAGMKQI